MNPQERQNIRNQTQQNHQQGVVILNYYQQTILYLLQLIENLQAEIENLKRDNDRLKGIEREYERYKEALIILQQQHKALQDLHEALKAEFELKKKEFCTFSAVCAKKINLLEEENKELRKKICDLERLLKVETEVSKQKIETLEFQNDNLKNERGTIKQRLEEFEKNYNNLHIEYRTYKDTSEVKIKDLLDRLALLEGRVNELQVDRNVLDIVSKLQVHLHCGFCDFATTCENYRACEHCVELNQEFDRLRAESEAQKHIELDEQRNRHENQVSELKESLNSKDKLLTKIKAEQVKSEEELIQLNDERQKLKDELRRAKRDLDESESQTNELRQDASRNSNRINDITSNIQRLDDMIKKIRLEQQERANKTVVVNCSHCCKHKSYVCAHLNEKFREFYYQMSDLLNQLNNSRYPRNDIVKNALLILMEFKGQCDTYGIS